MRKKKNSKFLTRRWVKISIFSIVIFAIMSISAYFLRPIDDVDYGSASYSLYSKIQTLNKHEIKNEEVYTYLHDMYSKAIFHSNIQDPNYVIYEHLADQNLEFYLLGIKDCPNPKVKL